MRVIGRWTPKQNPEVLGNARLVADPVGRRLFVVGSGAIAVYDLDSLEPLASPLTTASAGFGFDSPVFDQSIGALIVGAAKAPVASPFEDATRNVLTDPGTRRLAAIGFRDGTLRVLGYADLAAGVLPGARVVGMGRAPGSPWLYALTTVTNQISSPELNTQPRTVQLHQVDMRAFGGGGSAAQVKSIPDCMLPVATYVEAGVVVAGSSVLFGCGSFKFSAAQPVLPQGVGRVTLNADPTKAAPTLNETSPFELFTKNGNFAAAQSVADQATGRVALVWRSQSKGTILDLFEGSKGTWVGTVGGGGSGNIEAYGLNPVTGRLYSVVAGGGGGLMAVELRLPDVDQGHYYVNFPETTDPAIDIKAHPPVHNIAIDPKTSRLFFNYGDHITVVVDETPPIVADDDANPDAGTSDIDERSGLTDVNYGAAAQGYGARIRVVGGVENVTTNLAGSDLGDPSGVPDAGRGATATVTNPIAAGGGPDLSSATDTPSPFRSRELRLAYVDRLTLANAESISGVSTGERDPATQENEQYSPQQPVWPYGTANCADTGGEPAEKTEGAALAKCDADGAISRAVAVADKTQTQGVLIGKATIEASETRAGKATTTKMVSTAEGVSIFGSDAKELLYIGRITQRVTATAKGRPGTANVEHSEPVIEKVVIQGSPYCDTQCDPHALAAEINSRLTGLVRVSFPRAETAQSPGGYEAMYRRLKAEHSEDVALMEQPADRYDVPAMAITVLVDNQRPSRTIVELAAVEVESRYGIYRIGQGDAGIEGPTYGDVPPTGDLIGNLLAPQAPEPPSIVNLTGSSHGPGPLAQLLRLLRNPLRLFWNGSPGSTLVVWTMLLSPIYLSSRRWLLRRRSMLLEDVA